MPIGGAVNFLLGIERPIIYCIEYPMLQKKEKYSKDYGKYLYKIGIATRGINRLNTYLTYYPFAYVINYVLVMPKGSLDLKDMQKAEKFLFSLLKSKEKARPFDQNVRMNTAINKQEDETREFWEIDENILHLAFMKTKEFILKLFQIKSFLATPETIKETYRLIAGKLPDGIKMNAEEKEKNENLVLRVSNRGRDMIKKMPQEQRDMYENPSKYFEIDKRFDKNYKK